MKETKELIGFDKFLEIEKQLEIRIGHITDAVRIPKKDKLLHLTVNFGTESRDVVTNLGDKFEPEAFKGLTMPFIMNLQPAKMGGVMSTAMIMVGESEEGFLQLENYTVGSKLL